MCTMFGNQGMHPVRNQLAVVDVPYFIQHLELANLGSQDAANDMRKLWKEMVKFSQGINVGELEEMVEKAIICRRLRLKRPWKEYLQTPDAN